MELQLNTSVQRLTVAGIDVAARLRELGPYQDPNAWTLESTDNHWYQGAPAARTMPSIIRSGTSVSNTYMIAAWTKNPISYMMGLRPTSTTMAHIHFCLSPTQGTCDPSESFVFWVRAESTTDTTQHRTSCPPAYEGTTHTSGYIFHGTDAETGAGSTAPPDDGIMSQNPEVGDYYGMEIDGSSITFTSNRASTTPNGTPFRTCTVPAGTNFFGVINMYAPGQQVSLPFIKYA